MTKENKVIIGIDFGNKYATACCIDPETKQINLFKD